MSKHTGGPAYPQNMVSCEGEIKDNEDYGSAQGMSLRDYFAGQALGGMSAAVLSDKDAAIAVIGEGAPEEVLAEMAYEYADAMLAERNKGEGK